MNKYALIPLAFLCATGANAQPPGPPVSEPVDANVLNFPSVQTVDGTVTVSNFPKDLVTPFARGCIEFTFACTVDLTDLAAMGELHITHASGLAENVGRFATPRFGEPGTEVLIPTTAATTDAADDRDVTFSQSMDIIPLNPVIPFSEPESTRVFFFLRGYVIGPSAADVAAARAIGGAFTESQQVVP